MSQALQDTHTLDHADEAIYALSLQYMIGHCPACVDCLLLVHALMQLRAQLHEGIITHHAPGHSFAHRVNINMFILYCLYNYVLKVVCQWQQLKTSHIGERVNYYTHPCNYHLNCKSDQNGIELH